MKEKYENIIGKIDYEGFNYALISYSNWEDIDDPVFQKLRTAYVDAEEELNNYILSKAKEFGIESETYD